MTPCLEAFAKRSSERLHGVISFHEEAIPICGLTQSSSVIPTARSIPRCGARSIPSVTTPERGFMGLEFLLVIARILLMLVQDASEVVRELLRRRLVL